MIRVEHFSAAGGHPVNEDAFEVGPHPMDPECWTCLVADGQGGREGGGEAAREACRSAGAIAMSIAPRKLRDGKTWTKILKQADEKVSLTEQAGFAAFLGMAFDETGVWGASNGDCAVLAVSSSGAAVELTRDQIKNPPLGSGAAAITPFKMNMGGEWMLLAMTDGVWKYAGWDAIIAHISRHRGRELLDEILRSARAGGGNGLQDDFTLVVCEKVC
jgi:PPM family protein phosphatase